MRKTIRKEPLRRVKEGKAGEVVTRRSELARLGIGNQVPLLALCFPPVARVQRLRNRSRPQRNACAKCYRAF